MQALGANVGARTILKNQDLPDLTFAKDAKDILIYECNISDISPIAGAQLVCIDRPPDSFSDVPKFHNAKLVKLIDCNGVRDVSGLAGVRNVCLYNCAELEDVSPLANVPHLELVNCPKVTDVSALKGVDNLIMYHCEGVTDVSMLDTKKFKKMKFGEK